MWAPRIRFTMLIIRLLNRSRPSAVTRLIVSIVVGIAVNRVFRGWFWSHVRKEVLETILAKPSVTDFYPATTIIFVVADFRIPATFRHRLPALVFRSDFPFLRLAVSETRTMKTDCTACLLAAKASAGFHA